EHADEPGIGEAPHVVREHAGRERPLADDDARMLGRPRQLLVDDTREHEVADRAVSVPALEAGLVHRQRRTRARVVALERLEPRDARVPVPRFAAPLGVVEVRPEREHGRLVEPERGESPQGLVAFHRETNSSTGHPRAAAIRRSLRSGLTATGLPTASRNGRSVCESEYAVHCDRSKPRAAASSRTHAALFSACSARTALPVYAPSTTSQTVPSAPSKPRSSAIAWTISCSVADTMKTGSPRARCSATSCSGSA